ncbi:hypothetical protein ABW20_dc0101753 [Dactylellina cionopaga]|nr:hypothetical protein ABW20_dc0101753 [Dactylellina cionopaga]
MHTEPTSSSHMIIRNRRRIGTATSSSCSKSFARYCVALLGSLTVVSLAAPLPAAPITSSSASLLREGYEHGQKISRRIASSVENLSSLDISQQKLRHLYSRAQSSAQINKAATIVGVCGGIAFICVILAGFLYFRARRAKHRKGKCNCGEKGIACKYRSVASDTTLGHNSDDEDEEDEEDEERSRPRDRGGISPPVSPRQSLLGPPFPQKQTGERIRWSISSPRDSTGTFTDVEGFEYPPNYKPPPSAFRSHSPSASSEFLVPAGIANLVSPIGPPLTHRGLPISDDVTITPPRTPSPAIFAKRSQSPHVVSPRTQSPAPHPRARSLSVVDLSRTDGELQEDLDAIVRELQRRPRSGSIDIDSRLAPSRSNSPPPPAAASSSSQGFIMELEASPGMWNEDMQRDRGIVHEAVSQEFAVELDSRPLTLGVKRTRRFTGRFK